MAQLNSGKQPQISAFRRLHRGPAQQVLILSIALISRSSLGDSELWTIGADGTCVKRFAETPGWRCGSPDWSPDGKWVAYDTWPVGGSSADSQIAVIRADGTGARRLGPGAMPSWSPDGSQLVCHHYGRQVEIVVMNADGSGRETILNHWGSPRWSPRGNRIASIGTEGTIALFDCATGKEWTIFRGPYSLRQGFGISPNGLRFCFADLRGGIGLATLNEQTMQASVRWLVRSGQCYHASWAPDGRRVVYAWTPSDREVDQLYILDVDGDASPRALPGQDRTQTNTNPDWSPDGKTILFCRQVPAQVQSE
jgi:Tol biopolymer transport system component